MLQHIFNNNSNINNHKIHLIAVKLKVSKADNVTPKHMKSHKFKQQKNVIIKESHKAKVMRR